MDIGLSIQEWPLASSIALLLATWLFYTTSVIIYRLTLHPLSKFPGPKIAASTQLYEFYHDVIRGGQYQFLIQAMHARYGPIVRISPYELHIDAPDFYDELFTGAGNPRDKWNFTANVVGTPTSFFASVEHGVHRARRAPLNRLFSKKSVVQLSRSIALHVEKLCGRIETFRGTGRPLSLKYAFAALTIDVVSEYAFAKSYGALDDPDFGTKWLDAVDSILEGCYVNQFFPWLPVLMKKMPLWLVEKLNPQIMTIIKYQMDLSGQIQTIMSNPEEEKYTANSHSTIFHELLKSPDLPPEDRTMTHFTEEAQNIVGAGQTTTAYHLMCTAFHILRNPAILKRLQAELEQAMPDPNSLLSLPQLETLEYLTAIINEGHRIAPGNIHRLQRISPTPIPFSNEYTIPPGTPIGMSALNMHQHPDIFPFPYTFDPSRFLGPEATVRKRYLVPYSKGTRNCIGQNLAQAEIYMALAAVFRRFDFEIYDTERERDIDVAHDYITPKPKKGSQGLRVLVK